MIAFFLIVLYTLTVRQGTVVSDAFMNSADALIRKQDYLGLLAVCNRRNECIARITAKTLDFATRNPTASFEEVKEVTEAEGNRQSSLLLSRIAYLGDVGAVAPMLGLLGTILGIIDTFKALATAGVSDPGQISGGIGTALFATGLGIAIALFCVVFHNFFQDSLERINDQLKILLIRAATGARAQDEVTHRVPTPLHSRTA